MNEKYIQYLNARGHAMLHLAELMDRGGQVPLESADKELLRMAVLPAVRELQKEIAALFVVGVDIINHPEISELLAMFQDLKD